MNRPSVSSRHPLRLVQPFDDDTNEAVSVASLTDSVHSRAALRQLRGSSSNSSFTVHLASLHAPKALSEKLGIGERQHIVAGDAEDSGSNVSSLPFPPTHGQRMAATEELSSVPSVREDRGVQGSVSSSTRSLPGSTSRLTSSVDRLAALYRQYQIPSERKKTGGAPAKEMGREAHDAKSPTPPPALPARSAKSVVTRRRPVGGVERSGIKGQVPTSSVYSDAGENNRREARESAQGSSRTPLPSRLLTSSSGPSSAVGSAAGPRAVLTTSGHWQALEQQEQQRRGAVALPVSLSGSGVPGLMNTAIYVWVALGFFEMRPNEGEASSDIDSDGESVAAAVNEVQSEGSSAMQELSDPRDVERFLFAIEDFLNFYCSKDTTVSEKVLAEYTAFMRNGLWRVLFNAVFYCVSVLDANRCRRGPLRGKEREVRTGGPEDAYEVVFPSFSSVDDDVDNGPRVEREAPVRLTWRVPGESGKARAARCVRDPLPPDSPLRAGGPPYRYCVGGAKEESGFELRSQRGFDTASERQGSPPLDIYCGRLRAPLPVPDWYFTLRCLAQVGYRRDTFYLQTPFSASPLELLLALLWLTQQYKLLGVAEYVEMNRRYGFLLRYHVEESFWRAPVSGSDGVQHTAAPVSRAALTRERLLYHFSHAAVWPPASFDESSVIHIRLLQLERCLGRLAPHEAPSAYSAATPSTLHVRRLLSVQRLISLSLNRLHHALQRQAEQTVLLGLHSPLDAQLCRKEHHALYEDVMAGLAYVHEMGGRMRAAAECLGKAGLLVGFLLRYDEAGVSADDVLLSLEEDDATWLDSVHDEDDEVGEVEGSRIERASGLWKIPRQRLRGAKLPKGTEADRWQRAVRRGTLPAPREGTFASPLPTSAAALAQSLSTFRATQSRASLTETWKRLLRRSHVAPQTIPPENLRFLLDTEAQQIQEARVRENMKSRYSFQAALAAELAVLGYERQMRRQRSPSRSPLRSGRRSIDESASSRRMADTDAGAEARQVHVVLPPMKLVTNAATTFAQLQAEETAHGPVPLSTAELQLTEVGEPAGGSTTSARLELARLRAWEAELDEQLGVQAQTEARVANCKKMLETLYHQFGTRMATPLVQRKTRS